MHVRVSHRDSHDLWFLAVISWRIPHIVYRKFNIGISNEQFSQHEPTTIHSDLGTDWSVLCVVSVTASTIDLEAFGVNKFTLGRYNDEHETHESFFNFVMYQLEAVLITVFVVHQLEAILTTVYCYTIVWEISVC